MFLNIIIIVFLIIIFDKMVLENFNKDDINILWDFNEYDFSEVEHVMWESSKNPDDIDFNEFAKNDEIRQIISQFFNKNIDQLSMSDIVWLYPIQKAQLAREISAIQKIDKKISISWFVIDFKILNEYLENGWKMDIKSLNENMGVSLNAKWWHWVFMYIHKYHIDIALKEYKKMFRKEDSIPPMPYVCVLATWDLSSTAWIGWLSNKWRLYFDYDLESWNTTERMLKIWPLDTLVEIWISCNWIDIKDWIWWWSFDISFWSIWNLHWDYTDNWLIVDDSSLPEWVIWDVDNWILKIPQKIYKDIPISIKTKSNQYSSGLYDEVLFGFSCKNAIIGIAEQMYDIWNEIDLWWWQYTLSSKEKGEIWMLITNIMNEVHMSFAENIPVTILVSIDNTEFSRPEKFLDNGVWNISLKWVVDKYDDTILKQKIEEAFNQFCEKIDVSNFVEMSQQEAQRKLAEYRFLQLMMVTLENVDFRKQIISGKIKITPEFTNGQRKIGVKILEKDLIYFNK